MKNTQTTQPKFIAKNLLQVSPCKLKPWSNNPRKHSTKQLNNLERTIRELGFINPIIVDETNTVLAGHARLDVAKRLKMETVPIVSVSGLSIQQKRAYVIADNRMTDLSEWDPEKLHIEIETILADGEFDVELTGFDTSEIDLMFEPDEKNDEDDDPADLQDGDIEQTPPITQQGDLWALGKHKLYCGNALEKESYETLMDNNKAQMCFTDPPYNVSVKGHIRTSDDFAEFPMASGEMSQNEFTSFLAAFLEQVKDFSINGSIHYVCMDWRHINELQNAATPIFGSPKQLCVWVKNNGGMGSFYRSQHELIFVFKNGKAQHINNFSLGENGRYRTNVWHYKGVNSFGTDREEELAMHPTVKPIAMVKDGIMDCSKHGGIILDPFCGSGTTIMAAEKSGRICYGMELDPTYVDVTIKRWQRLYSEPVIHTQTGLTYEEVKLKRQNDSSTQPSGGEHE